MFSQTNEYALRAMNFLASLGAGQSARSETIAEKAKMPQGYLLKVMRDLVVSGLVNSQRGPNGGFSLARPPQNITLLEVVNAVDPLPRIRSCPLGNPAHTRLCPLHQRIDNAVHTIEEQFARTTLAEIIAETNADPSRCGTLAGASAVVPLGLPGKTG